MPAQFENMLRRTPEPCPRIHTKHRRITTDLPVPESLEILEAAVARFPQVNSYQPPIVWDKAHGYQVFDRFGNCWIDFTSTAVMTNSGHGHPAVRDALQQYLKDGMLAQFSWVSEIRIELAERLIGIAPDGCDKVYFWTVGSEATECALRLAREYSRRQNPNKTRIITHSGDYHGWTLGAHQLSGTSAQKEWLSDPDRQIHHIPFPNQIDAAPDTDWPTFFDDSMAQLSRNGIEPSQVAGIFFETIQGWSALPLPTEYVQRARQWADENDVLLIFDEIQTGFGRTGKWFGHEHYNVRPDLLCIGKGLSSSLPIAAVLGPSHVLDVLSPGEVTSTHAAHPVSCAAALANLQVLEDEGLITAAAEKGEIARRELSALQQRFPDHIAGVSGLGLLNAIRFQNPETKEPDFELAREVTWSAVKNGVMLFFTGQPTVKVCPPLVIPEDAIIEGITTVGEVLGSVLTQTNV